MVDSSLAKIIRDTGLAQVLQPAAELRQQQANARVIDETGAISRQAAAPFRTPLAMHWAPSDTSRKRVARAGSVALLAAYASTAPTTGDAKITLTSMTALSGVETLVVLTIPQGESFAEVSSLIAVSSGAWIGTVVTTANGAAGISVSVTISQG